MVNKTKSVKTGKKKKAKKTSAEHALLETTFEPGQPFQIIGSWRVKNVTLGLGTTIGIDAGDSVFDIKPADATKIFLEKVENVAWNGNSTEPIPLTDLPPGHPDRNQGMLVQGTVKLGGQDFRLTLGTKNKGKTLRIQLVSVEEPMTQPGGSGSAGRGG